MKIYIQVIEKKIISVDSEKNEYCLEELNLNSTDDFFDYCEKNEYEHTDEIDEEVVKIFDDEEETNSLSTYKIKHWVSNRSFGELIDMYDNDEIIKPDMQREFVWSSQKCSRLIESIILGLPIPPLFLMETGSNEYEIIDGFQRINTLSNYINEYSWTGEKGTKRSKAKLTGNVAEEIRGLSFEALPSEYQRKIKRSTIPLIEFKQMDSTDTSSKYLIFERINTGSEKLNDMQIRKSLAYGPLIKSVYEKARMCKNLRKSFSSLAIKKDADVEALLRVFVMSEIFYKKFQCEKQGINLILNDYCEKNRTKEIPDVFMEKFNDAWVLMESIFVKPGNMFRRVVCENEKDYSFAGNMNVSILEAMMGVATYNALSASDVNIMKVQKQYFETMYMQSKNAIEGKAENPFSTSTGMIASIKKRFLLCEKILGIEK